MKIEENAIYELKDEYFEKYPDINLLFNNNRDTKYFYIVKDKKKEGIYWAVPFFPQDEKIKKFIEEKYNGDSSICPFYVLSENNGSIFSIGKSFPINSNYIEVEDNEKSTDKKYIVKSDKIITEIHKKLFKYVKFMIANTIQSMVDINKIIIELQNEKR